MRSLLKFSIITLAAVVMAACSNDGPTDPNDDDDDDDDGNPGATATMALAGNIVQCGFGSEARAAATAGIIDTLPASTIVVPLGDNVSEANVGATSAAYNDCYQETWGKFLSRTRPVFGNHEHLAGGSPFYSYFGGSAGTAGQGWYSYEAGPWHVITLNIHDNASYGSTSAQMLWLAGDLAANENKQCVMAVFHDSYFQSSSTNGFWRRTDKQNVFQALYDADVDLVVTGGMHFYERMSPMDPLGVVDQARGITHINVGTGGESVLPPAFTHPNSVSLNGNTYGVLVLKLNANSANYSFVPSSGTHTDAGTVTCH